jgi:hypothetical protein
MARLLHELRQPNWRDSEGPEHGNKFWLGSFLDFFKKKTKYKKRRMGQTTRAVWCRVTEREERGGNGELTD